jgi:hypothetical protein
VPFGRNRESRSREAAGRRNWPEAVPRKMRGRKRVGLLNWEDRCGMGRATGRTSAEHKKITSRTSAPGSRWESRFEWTREGERRYGEEDAPARTHCLWHRVTYVARCAIPSRSANIALRSDQHPLTIYNKRCR